MASNDPEYVAYVTIHRPDTSPTLGFFQNRVAPYLEQGFELDQMTAELATLTHTRLGRIEVGPSSLRAAPHKEQPYRLPEDTRPTYLVAALADYAALKDQLTNYWQAFAASTPEKTS